MKLFGEVITIIQIALSKTSCETTLSPGTIATDVEMSVGQVTAFKTNMQYIPLQQRQPAATSRQPKFLLEKTNFYKGKTQSKSLYKHFGYTFIYYKEDRPWCLETVTTSGTKSVQASSKNCL
ncbi:hypothetical protein VP01_1401g2 [Puccinia sorghi]|uniref:Uncharacterized protein n=1 Tax=Puccinia sorghi TaxID=27349 RepID=A0A0L6VMT9_9BASI|nr:hypothetical protein VP01_1401g2 [Puccinia sorghi]